MNKNLNPTRTLFGLLACQTLALGCSSCGARNDDVVVPEEGTPFSYDAHEWGFIDFDPQRGLDLQAGPIAHNPQSQAVMVVTKPVIYFHRHDFRIDPRSPSEDNGAHLSEPIRVSVFMPRGHLREVWPGTLPTEAQSSVFAPVGLMQLVGDTLCAVPDYVAELCDASPASDGFCERRELQHYASPDASCLNGPIGSIPFLFYRGDVRNVDDVRLPFVLSEEVVTPVAGQHPPYGCEGLPIRATNWTGSGQDVSRWFRIHRHGGQIAYSEGSFDAAGSVLPPPVSDVDRDTATAHLRQDLLQHGLTDGEAAAFMAAWTTEIFGSNEASVTATVTIETRTGADTSLQADDLDLLYFWAPRAWIESDIARVEFDPAPVQFRRAILVRVRNVGALATNQ